MGMEKIYKSCWKDVCDLLPSRGSIIGYFLRVINYKVSQQYWVISLENEACQSLNASASYS